MNVSSQALVAILGMAAVTYLTRVSGIWIIGKITLSHRLETALRFIPGCVLVSIVAPALLDSGWRGVVAGAVTAALAWRTRSPLVAMVGGVLCIVLLRAP